MGFDLEDLFETGGNRADDLGAPRLDCADERTHHFRVLRVGSSTHRASDDGEHALQRNFRPDRSVCVHHDAIGLLTRL